MTEITLQQAARDALMVQNACNLSGVAHSFLQAVQAVNACTSGTHERNTHPILQLYVDKLASLACGDSGLSFDAYHDAAAACKRITEE